MDSENRRENRRRRNSFLVERLESRELLTVLVHHIGQNGTRLARQAGQIGTPLQISALGQGTSTVAPLPSNQNGSVLGPPTTAELAKLRFTVGQSGSFSTSPGRYVGEPLQAEVVTTGGSNQSLHLNGQMQFFLYNDKTAVPTGQIALSPKNVSSTGTLLVLDLTSDGTSFSHGLPTHYTWTVNPASGGLYANATGSGTLDISFFPTKVRKGGFPAGKAFIKANGTVTTSHGLTLDTATAGNRSNPLG